VLWKEVDGPGNAISPCFRDEVKVTTIVVFGWAEEPSVKAVGPPRYASIGIFINDCLGAKGCHWVAIPVVRAIKGFVSGVIWIDSQLLEQVDGILNLRGKFVPKLDQEVGVGRAERADEAILEGLDGLFGSVNAMIVWLDKLEHDILGHKVYFDYLCCLVVRHV
jgi:hypothetical protein